ncbi:uncharacterized protein LOC126373697 [Pectinophora gossypiella]|uniref:uncharacterized protein LOC126373697 n=1 Tax=Pectinophora gossypiella TaxID=13191 RepID=UPI00214E4C16|nr:uncharacterized protein LOC126373697 [Pectinophora gossypiella]
MKSDRKSRLEACSLHTDAYTMVADEIDPQLELECQLVARRRRDQGEDDDSYEATSFTDFIYLAKLSSSQPDTTLPARQVKVAKSRGSLKRRRLDTCCKGPNAKRPRVTTKNKKRSVTIIRERQTQKDADRAGVTAANPNDDILPNSKVIINTAELNAIMSNNIVPLCQVGLEALIDLHAQLSKTVHAFSDACDRTHLPKELHAIVSR